MGHWKKCKTFSPPNYIDVRCNQVMKVINSDNTKIAYVPMKQMFADFLTESLGPKDSNSAVKGAAMFRAD